MTKYKVLALFGKSGAGKDFLEKYICDTFPEKTAKIISYTTRPKRDNEEDDVDYHFVSPIRFCCMKDNNQLLEHTEFNGWYYGTSTEGMSTEKINVGVFNLAGIHSLLNREDIIMLPIYVQAPDKERLLHCLNREENPNCAEICRRFFTDEKDFTKEQLHFYYWNFINNYSTLNKNTWELTLSILKDCMAVDKEKLDNFNTFIEN